MSAHGGASPSGAAPPPDVPSWADWQAKTAGKQLVKEGGSRETVANAQGEREESAAATGSLTIREGGNNRVRVLPCRPAAPGAGSQGGRL
jgi:hypothetical protein